MNAVRRGVLAAAMALLPSLSPAVDWRISGYVSGEFQGFFEDPLDPVQSNTDVSLAAEPEFYTEWNDGADAFTFSPFARLDQRDDERTHADIRELKWLHVGSDWELRAGADIVFWGVTESQHLVDIINQTDLVEDIDGEDKLGQPMVNLALIRDWGTLNLFVLTGFRERTFPSAEGRPRVHPPVKADAAIYESSAEQAHVDFAVRWSDAIGNWDLGLSHFHGTTREPRFLLNDSDPQAPFLVPLYEQIDQTGLDVQLTQNSWLWKLEAIRRSGQGPTFHAATGGFEYTFYGVFGSVGDIGVVGEYLYDERPIPTRSPFENDVFGGLRFTLNDPQSSDALVGCIFDLDSSGRICSVEASRRFGDRWVGSLEMRTFTALPETDPFYTLRNDDYVQLSLFYYF